MDEAEKEELMQEYLEQSDRLVAIYERHAQANPQRIQFCVVECSQQFDEQV
jgi:hypothetical protein